MKGILILIKKEFWEWSHSLKKIAMLGVVFLFLIIAKDAKGTIFVSASAIGGLLVIMTAIGGISHIVFESLLEEKKNKTLELLVATKLSPISIVMGKLIPGMIVGIILSAVIAIILNQMNITIVTHINAALIINFLQFTFLSGSIVFIFTLLIPDEKVYSMLSMVVLVFILGILKGMIMIHLTLYSIITIPVLLIMNIIAAYSAKTLLIKTKLFLRL